MYHMYYNSAIGPLKIIADEEAITAIEFTKEMEEDNPNAMCEVCVQQLIEYFDGVRTTFSIAVDPQGTLFQKRVWNALKKIPYGQTCSYKQIAIACGNEKASRAIGMANNRNPIPIIIPCHRVVGSNGKLVGYAGGLDKKTLLLELEQNH